MRGVSDIIGVLPGGRAFFMEVKTKRGVVSEFQKTFLRQASEAGAAICVARSLDDVRRFYGKHAGLSE